MIEKKKKNYVHSIDMTIDVRNDFAKKMTNAFIEKTKCLSETRRQLNEKKSKTILI